MKRTEIWEVPEVLLRENIKEKSTTWENKSFMCLS